MSEVIEIPIQYACPECKNNFSEKEQAIMCSRVCKELNPLSAVIHSIGVDKHKKLVTNLVTILEKFAQDNQFKFFPFEIEGTDHGCKITLLEEPEDQEISLQEGLTWLKIADILNQGAVVVYDQDSFQISYKYAEVFVIAIQVYYANLHQERQEIAEDKKG